MRGNKFLYTSWHLQLIADDDLIEVTDFDHWESCRLGYIRLAPIDYTLINR